MHLIEGLLLFAAGLAAAALVAAVDVLFLPQGIAALNPFILALTDAVIALIGFLIYLTVNYYARRFFDWRFWLIAQMVIGIGLWFYFWYTNTAVMHGRYLTASQSDWIWGTLLAASVVGALIAGALYTRYHAIPAFFFLSVASSLELFPSLSAQQNAFDVSLLGEAAILATNLTLILLYPWLLQRSAARHRVRQEKPAEGEDRSANASQR